MLKDFEYLIFCKTINIPFINGTTVVRFLTMEEIFFIKKIHRARMGIISLTITALVLFAGGSTKAVITKGWLEDVLTHVYGRWQAIVDDKHLKVQEVICQELNLPVVTLPVPGASQSQDGANVGDTKANETPIEEPEIEAKVLNIPSPCSMDIDSQTSNQLPQVINGVPKGLRIEDVLGKIAMSILIRDKVKAASEKPGTPSFPDDVVSRFPRLKSGRFWKEHHDLLLLRAVLKKLKVILRSTGMLLLSLSQLHLQSRIHLSKFKMNCNKNIPHFQNRN
ncbi:hypothetical protein HYC85_010490 [Camellia sinensis]|uniref:CHD subfamily II SANT-like domain-containing protein n=1 Tax=Camellia sinensis TaxID=4442 RepID=A0A7J7HKS7_CAMSI|nr:hypothetical protein HYC85_010490 [Camellia sinensis]